MRRLCLGVIGACLLAGCAVQADRPMTEADARRAALANTDLAVYHLRNDELARARDKAGRAIAQDPRQVGAYLVAAEVESRLDAPELAESFYREALELAPDNGSVLNNYAGFLCREGRISRALDLFDMAAGQRLYDNRVVALANAGRCLADAQRYAEAGRYWRAALDDTPGFPPALRGMAELHLERGDTDAAWAAFSRYTAVSEETASLLWLGVRIARADDNAERYASFAQRLRQRFPDSGETARLTE